MCRSMVDIQSATAEIRRGKKKERKKKQDKNIMSASATQGGHNERDESQTDDVRRDVVPRRPAVAVGGPERARRRESGT